MRPVSICDTMSHMEHGTLSTYTNHKCRCEPCRQARRDFDAARRSRLTSDPADRRHGTASGYKIGCRCARCKVANREHVAAYRQSQIDMGAVPHGTASGYTVHRCRCAECSLYGKTQRLRRYGLTVGEFDSLLERQNNKCASCGDEFASERDAHIDHDHDSGEVRGLLCQHCNQALGHLRDDPKRIKALLAFITQ